MLLKKNIKKSSNFVWNKKAEHYLLFILLYWLLPFANFKGILSESVDNEKKFGPYIIVNLFLVFFLIKKLRIKIDTNYSIIKMMYVIVGWVFIIHFFRDNYLASLYNFINTLLTQIIILLVANLAWKLSLKSVIKTINQFLIIILCICIYVHIVSAGPIIFGGNHLETDRLGGLFFFGITGTLSGLGLVLSTYYFFFFSNKNWQYLIFPIFYFICLLATDLRTGLLASSISILFQYYCYLKYSKKNLLYLFVIILMLIISNQLYNAYSEAGKKINQDFNYRQILWGIGIQGIMDSPIVGYSSVGDFFESHKEIIAKASDDLRDPHSSYLALILQFGIITFLLFIIIIYKVFFLILKNTLWNRKAIFSILLFWLVMGISGGGYFNFNYYDLTTIFFEFTLFGICTHPYILKLIKPYDYYCN